MTEISGPISVLANLALAKIVVRRADRLARRAVLRLKPQNLISGLPVRHEEAVN